MCQVAFGSGFKCNSAVWLCMNNRDSSKEPAAFPTQAGGDSDGKKKAE